MSRIPSTHRFRPKVPAPRPSPSPSAKPPSSSAPAQIPPDSTIPELFPIPSHAGSDFSFPPSLSSTLVESSQDRPSTSSMPAPPLPPQISSTEAPRPLTQARLIRPSPSPAPRARSKTPRARSQTPRPERRGGPPLLVAAATAFAARATPQPSPSLPPSLLPAVDGGIPPSLGLNTASAAIDTTPSNAAAGPSTAPARNDTADLAAAITAAIAPLPGSIPPPNRRRKRASGDPERRGRKSKATLKRLAAAAAIAPVLPPQPPPLEPGPPRKRGRPRREPVPDSEPPPDPPSPGTAALLRKRGPYGSRGRAGTSRDQRISVNRVKHPPISHPELDDVQPDDMIGMTVDPQLVTMKDLATKLVSEGKVSSRAVRIHAFQRDNEMRKRHERDAHVEEVWKRKQIMRRKLRAVRNSNRAQRRVDITEGTNDVPVSEDEDDSEEEFEAEPDRLTPPSSPEPIPRLQPVQIILSSDPGYRPPNQPQTLDEIAETLDAEAERPLFLSRGETAEPGADAAEEEVEDPATAELRRAGFITRSPLRDGEEGNGEADEEDEEEDDQEIGLQGADLDAFREEREAERRRAVAQAGELEVEEIDEENRLVNSLTFARRVRPARWTDEDTEFFYVVIAETGENYSLMKAYFPGRTVSQLKRKGLRENRLNAERMTAAILSRQPIDKAYLSKSAGLDMDRDWAAEKRLYEDARVAKESLKAEAETPILHPGGIPPGNLADTGADETDLVGDDTVGKGPIPLVASAA